MIYGFACVPEPSYHKLFMKELEYIAKYFLPMYRWCDNLSILLILSSKIVKFVSKVCEKNCNVVLKTIFLHKFEKKTVLVNSYVNEKTFETF